MSEEHEAVIHIEVRQARRKPPHLALAPSRRGGGGGGMGPMPPLPWIRSRIAYARAQHSVLRLYVLQRDV